MKKTNNKGFTLIELLVVIAIIGLLSTLAVVSLNNARAKARDAKRVADVKQTQTALEMFFTECNGYPTATADTSGATFQNTGSFSTLTTTAVYDSDGAGDSNDCPGGSTEFGDFMAQIPTPPQPTDNNTLCDSTDGWAGGDANTYNYAACNEDGTDCDGTVPSIGASYALEYCLGAQSGGLSAGPHYANPSGM